MSKDEIKNYGKSIEVLQEAIIRTFENRRTPYNADSVFFREGFAENPQMRVRWQAFMRKITQRQDLSFSEVVKFIQSVLRAYWENLSGQPQ